MHLHHVVTRGSLHPLGAACRDYFKITVQRFMVAERLSDGHGGLHGGVRHPEDMSTCVDTGMAANSIFTEMSNHMEDFKQNMQIKVFLMKQRNNFTQPHELSESLILPSFRQVKKQLLDGFRSDFNRWLEALHFELTNEQVCLHDPGPDQHEASPWSTKTSSPTSRTWSPTSTRPSSRKTGAGVQGFSGHSDCLLYTSPSPRDVEESRMPSSA